MSHVHITIALTALSLCTHALADSPPTMRVDFYHSGNQETEMFSLDQVVIEPLGWPGNMQWPIDRTLRGKYLFEVVDADSGDITWSRSFSSIYGEWETTSEAKLINRTFHESLRFPAQDGAFEVVLKKRAHSHNFVEIWRIAIDPDDYLVHRESARHADNVVAILDNGDPATKVDLLLLGDGYTAGEHDDFLAKARELTDSLFSTSPFKERKSDFNVWALAPPSVESGVSRPSTNTYRDSPVGATYDAFRAVRYILTYENKAMRRIASSAPYDFIEILTNTEVYGGGGIYGLFGTVAANSEWAPYVFVHEFGHHFAGLADEYYTSAAVYESREVIVEPYEPNVTALKDPSRLNRGLADRAEIVGTSEHHAILLRSVIAVCLVVRAFERSNRIAIFGLFEQVLGELLCIPKQCIHFGFGSICRTHLSASFLHRGGMFFKFAFGPGRR